MTRADYTKISNGLNIYKKIDTPYQFAKMYIGDKKISVFQSKKNHPQVYSKYY